MTRAREDWMVRFGLAVGTLYGGAAYDIGGWWLTLASAVAAFERDLIIDTLKSTSGNIAGAARQLESTERILGYKIKKYGIDTIRFRK